MLTCFIVLLVLCLIGWLCDETRPVEKMSKRERRRFERELEREREKVRREMAEKGV